MLRKEIQKLQEENDHDDMSTRIYIRAKDYYIQNKPKFNKVHINLLSHIK